MNSRVFCYQVIPCLQWLQKWLYVNHAVNNAPVWKADATANCGAWGARRNHSLPAPARSLGLSPSLRQDATADGARVILVPSAALAAKSWGADGLGERHGQPRAVPMGRERGQHRHSRQTAGQPAHATHPSNIYPLFQS